MSGEKTLAYIDGHQGALPACDCPLLPPPAIEAAAFLAYLLLTAHGKSELSAWDCYEQIAITGLAAGIHHEEVAKCLEPHLREVVTEILPAEFSEAFLAATRGVSCLIVSLAEWKRKSHPSYDLHRALLGSRSAEECMGRVEDLARYTSAQNLINEGAR